MAKRTTTVKKTAVKYKIGDVLLVRWFDAHNHESGWEELKDLKPVPCEAFTAGFFLMQTEDELILAGDLIKEGTCTNTRMCIPLGMVKEVTKVHNAE